MEFVEQVSEETNEVSIPIRNTLCEDPKVYTYNNYLTNEECDHFIKVGKPNLKRAYVSDTKQGTISKGRTGTNYWLVHNHDEITRSVGKRISELIGVPLENAESYQFIHYNETQRYDQHWDSYTLNDSEKCRRCLKYGGQRMVTCLLYLNTVEEGGGTRFNNLNIESKAEKGKMLVFHNCLPGTNTPHPNSLHAGCPVLKGEKYAINLWFREISMKKIYDFPFLKDMEKKEEEKVTMNVEEEKENNTIEINSSNENNEISSSIINARPKIIQLSGLLNNEECKYILSQCKNGNKQNKGRLSYWVKNDNNNIDKILDKFSTIVGIKDKSYFESMNIMEYPVGTDHGCHFDAFDLTSERGKDFSKNRGQRLYTFVCLLNENNDKSNGRVEFRDYPKDIILNQGDSVLYKNTENEGTPIFQRNTTLEYAVGPCRSEPKKYLYLYLREKGNGNQLTLKNVQNIDYEVEHINMNINTKVTTNTDLKKQLAELNSQIDTHEKNLTNVKQEIKEEPKEEENYYDTLDTFYDKLNTTGNIQMYKSLKSRRHNSPIDLETLNALSKCRENTWSDKNKSLVQTKHFEVEDYKQDEFTPIVVDNVFTDEVRDLFINYFKNTIVNDKFQFGDKQSQRYKAYDDLMSRIMQYECLPIIEKITKKKLKPTYTYFSGYAKDADLPPHTDRPECAFTVSFLVDKPEGSYWPIYIDKKKQPIKYKGRYRDYVIEDNIKNCIPVDCDAGGLMCFQGTDHIHFREKLEHDYYYITLLHYQIVE